MKRTIIGAVLSLALVTSIASTKSAVLPNSSCNPNFVNGQVPPAAVWNAAIGCAFPKIGGLLSGPIGLPSATLSSASFNISPGVTPITPSDGDMWVTSAGFFVQASGSTIGPLGSGGSGGSVSGFQPTPAYSQLSVGAGSSNVALPQGPQIVIYNTGSNPAYVLMGTSNSVAATSANDVVPAGGWMAFSVGSNTFIAAIETAGTTALNISGGSGLPTGSGGGGGSGALPTGAATSANQATEISSLANIATAAAASSTAANQTNGSQKTQIVDSTGANLGTSGNPLYTIGGGSGSNASVGANNTTAPTSSTQLGCQDATGKIQANSASNPCYVNGGTVQAGASIPISISTATTTQLVAPVSGAHIYITAWDVIAAGTGNITLEYGTGSNCGTGTTALTGAYPFTAQVGISKGVGLGPVLIVPASNALCALTSTAVQMSGSVSYLQQ